MPPTSVVIVNFNAGALLSDAVSSVLASTVPVEVIVVDNGSQDDSLRGLREKAGGDPRLRLLENPGNLGFARACNQGLALAGGENILFLNPDAVVEPDTLARMLRALEAHPEAGMAGCLVVNPDGTEQEGCRRSLPTPARAFVRAFGLKRFFRGRPGALRDFTLSDLPLPAGPAPVEAISGAFMFVRRAAIAEVGPLDEGYFLHCEDLDWCFRFGRAGRTILFVPEARIVHERGRCGRDRPLFVQWHLHRGMLRFYRKFYLAAYPRPFYWLVACGVAARFAVLALVTLLRRPFASFGRA